MRGFLRAALVVGALAHPIHAADLTQGEWKAAPATGVQMSLTRDAGRTGNDALKIDFDFNGHGGYAIARRDGAIELPDNFELAFWMRADAPRNTLEVKLVSGENVWWSTRREFDFPREWRRLSIRKRDFEFAWGPAGPGPVPKHIDAIEIVVTAGTGGRGTVWLDDVALNALDAETSGPLPRACNLPWSGRGPFTWQLGRRYEIGGIVVDWEKAPANYRVTIGETTKEVTSSGGRDAIALPDADGSSVVLDFSEGSIRDLRLLPPMRGDNDFFAAIARDAPRGDYPRYLLGEQSYWTVVGGKNGEESEALIGEDGAIEAGDARFSIEPFLWIDGKLVTWSDVAVEQHEGPSVEWKKHLTITPRVDGDVLRVRYAAAPNARLVLAIRPFQVNTPWQFLKRTGGVVKITRVARDGNTVRVDADKSIDVTAPIASFGITEGNIVEALRAQKLPAAQELDGEFLSAAMTFDSNDVEIVFPLSPAIASSNEPPSWSVVVNADPRIEATLRAQLGDILINRDGPSIQPGSRSYERSWIRDGSLTSTALLRLGRADVVREFLVWYAKAIREDGYVPCCVSASGLPDPVPEHDSHGQFIYLAAEYYRHTHDRATIDALWPKLQNVVSFIDRLRHERMTAKCRGTAFYGMVPESISHEGYSAKAMHSYWDDFFILRGLKDAAFLARELGSDDAKRYAAMRDEFQRDLLASLALSMNEHRIDYIPGSVELGDFDATSTTVALSPGDAGDVLPQAALRRTFEKYLEHAFEPRLYTPYEWRTVGSLIRLGMRDEAHRLIDYFFEDQRPAAWHQWAEVVRPDPREGGFLGDMPHTWVGSDFIRSVLDLFAYEEGDALVVGAGVSREWARAGVSVRGISTHYGLLDYSIAPEGNALRVRIGGDLRVPPGGIRLVSPSGGVTVVRTLPADILLKEGS